MKRLKYNTKRIKVSEYFKPQYSNKEAAWNSKYGIWMPENSTMTIEKEIPKSFFKFQKELKELHPNLYMVYNKNPSPPDAPYGHAVRIRDARYPEGFDIVSAVGMSGNRLLPSNTQYTHYKDNITNEYKTRFTCLGWSECLNQVITYLIKNNLAKKA